MKLSASRAMSWRPRFSKIGINGANHAERICSRDQRGPLSEGLVTVFSPMRLNEDTVDLLEVHDAGLVADGFDEGAETQVAGPA